MGMFDIGIRKENKHNKEILTKLKNRLESNGQESTLHTNLLEIEKFKLKGSLLSYDLKVELVNNSLAIDGELKEVLILTILIILSILFTYGIGVGIVVIYTYYQKIKATKYIESIYKSINT